jgi:hypothetical protein
MKSETYPLAVPPDLLADVRETAKQTGLSVADAMRQSIKMGLPKLKRQLARPDTLKPFTPAESRRAFAPDKEWDELEAAMSRLPIQRNE